MKRLLINLPAYIQIAGLWPQMAFTYRVDFAFRVLVSCSRSICSR